MLHSHSCKQKVEFISIPANETGSSPIEQSKSTEHSRSNWVRKTWMCTWLPEEMQELSIAVICIMARVFASVFKDEFPLECEIQAKSEGWKTKSLFKEFNFVEGTWIASKIFLWSCVLRQKLWRHSGESFEITTRLLPSEGHIKFLKNNFNQLY